MTKGTITRRTDLVLNDLQDEFKALCDRKDFENKIKALKKAGDRSDRPSRLRDLFDLFDRCGIEYERGRDNAYYEKLVRQADIPDYAEIEKRMFRALFARYREYPSPEDYMRRIVDRLCSEEDGWHEDALRIRILKQFIKYGDYLKDAGFRGKSVITDYVKAKTGRKQAPREEEVLALLDDGVFDGLASATKAQRKPDGKYGLLKTADDLATGKFRMEGATKKALYLFAMVYGMTYYSGGAQIVDHKTDIEVNLFRDYYTNNLMRFITDVYKGRLSEYELDPSGQGINYKNFAEMIYLYYISQDLNPLDKIRLSAAMIDRVQEKAFKKGRIDTDELGGTLFYRDFFKGEGDLFSEDILSLPEDEFEQFICENYNCDLYAGSYETKNGKVNRKESPLQLEQEQNSAFREYQSIIADLEGLGMPLERCNYGLAFTDVASFRRSGSKSILGGETDTDGSEFEEFLELLRGMNSFMGYTVEEKEAAGNGDQEWKEPSKMKTRALYVTSPRDITRTSMLVAYYYYYNARHEADMGQHRSFEEVFNRFKRGVDRRLEAAYYQPLSGKNIFDVLVVFSSYAYLSL